MSGKSRHVPIKGALSRSFGVDAETDEDVVGIMSEDGFFTIRREPVGRKLKRNEKLPEVKFKVAELAESLSAPEAPQSDVTAILEKILKKLPIAKFSETNPNHVAYEMKVWLLAELKEAVDKSQTT